MADEAPDADETAARESGSGIERGYGETLVVTASRTHVTIRDAPVSVTVIDEAYIDASPADNFADLLRGVPGVSVVQLNNRDVNLTPRGAAGVLTSDQLLLVDGRSAYLNYQGVVVWDYLPVSFEEIKRIEVARGPGSAVWGANAVTGVINLITKSPREIEGGLLNLECGENGTLSASLLWAQAFDKWSYKLSASYYQQDAWSRPSTMPDGSALIIDFENLETEQPNLDIRADRDLANGAVLSYKAGFGGTSGVIHSRIGPFQIEKWTRVEFAEVNYRTNRWDGKAYWSGLRGDAPNLVNGLPFRFVTDAYVLDITARQTIGDNQLLVYGGSLKADRFDLSIAPGEDAGEQAGGFIEDSIILGNSVSLNLGVRLDHFDTIGSVVSPRTSLIFSPTPRHAWRLGYSQAYRTPAQVENYIATAVPNAFPLPSGDLFFYSTDVLGNADLTESRAESFELGYTGSFGRATLTAALYRNETRDQINFVPAEFFSVEDVPPGWPLAPGTVPAFTLVKTFSYLNFGEIINQGLELGLRYRLRSDLTTAFSYTFQDAPRVTNDRPTLPFSANIPSQHQAAARIETHSESWRGSLSLTYTGEAFWADVLDQRFWGSTDDYILVDASFIYTLKGGKIELMASGTNLLDDQVQQHIFGDIIGRRASGGVRFRW